MGQVNILEFMQRFCQHPWPAQKRSVGFIDILPEYLDFRHLAHFSYNFARDGAGLIVRTASWLLAA